MKRSPLQASSRIALVGVLTVGLSGGAIAAQSATAAPTPAAVSQSTPQITAGLATITTRAQGRSAVRIAASKRGAPYRYGAAGPRTFDCSGLTKWVYARVGKRLPRTAHQQYRSSVKIRKSAARPGDLVFFGGARKYHVGIYAGNGRIWHAPRTGKTVSNVKIWSSRVSYGRVR